MRWPVTLMTGAVLMALPVAAVATCGGNWGSILATYRGQNAYSNGPDFTCVDGRTGTYGNLYQCVEFAERFYGEAMHFTSAPWSGNGDEYYGSAATKGLRSFVQGGVDKPMVNDILCFSGGAAGHVAIISAVGASSVTITDQNRTSVDSNDPYTLTMTVANGHYTVGSFSSSYPVQGWLRGYTCGYLDQSPGTVDLVAGQAQLFQVRYTNTARSNAPHWKRDGGNYALELRTSDPNGNEATCFLEPVAGKPSWLDTTTRKRVVYMSENDVGGNAGVATFQFWAQVPVGSPLGMNRVYFRPYHNSGQWLESWDGMYFPINVIAGPTVPSDLSVNPVGCSQTNSFTFAWGPSTEAGGSGIAGYRWQIDNGAIAQTTALSVTTTSPYVGSPAFKVWGYDNANNVSGVASAGFCYQLPTGPCSGRQIPNTCVSSTQCYPASAANLQTLPAMSPDQWQTVGQPVRELLVPGRTYSIGFEYRSTAASDIKLRLGTFSPTSLNLGLAVGQSTLPASTSDWKTYWSAPFGVTVEQLRKFSSLRFVRSQTAADGLEIRNVRILTVR